MKNYDLIVFSGGVYAYAPKRITEESEKMGISCLAAPYKDISAEMSDTKLEVKYLGEDMPFAKGIFLRALGEDAVYNALKVYIINHYTQKGAKVLNSNSFNKWPSLDKTTQYLELKKSGVPIVESFFFGSKLSFIEWAKKEKMPIIVKESIGSLGTGVFKINSIGELEELLSKYSIMTVKTLLVQRFLEGGEDLRVIVLNKKIVGAMKRIAKEGTYLTNYSQGGSVEKYDIDNDLGAKETALKVTEIFDLDYCGVDLMKDKDGTWKVLEVNRACQFQGFEKSTGINVAKQVVEYLTS